MKFTVVWQRHAEDALAELWQSTENRAAVTRATNHIDQVLAASPDRVGEQRPKTDRVFFVEPLGVRYRISFDDRLVQVLGVWDITAR